MMRTRTFHLPGCFIRLDAESGWMLNLTRNDMVSELKRLEATVYGLVQGVGYRWYARQMARRLNLSGYVRNRSDGTVEVVAEGQEHTLRALLAYLESGPSAASVQRVDARWSPASSKANAASGLVGFEVRF